jgi:putative oxidoreductase
MKLCTFHVVLSWTLQIMAAVILGQTLFFKFTAAPESVHIFTTLGMEPWGRLGSGVAELIAVVLLLMPHTVTLGALLALGIISGAIASHLTKLGLVVKDDGGLLFALALTVFAASAIILVLRRVEIPFFGGFFRPVEGFPVPARGGSR